MRQLHSQDEETLTHTWESLKTVPESVLLAGGRSSKSTGPSCASFPKTDNLVLEQVVTQDKGLGNTPVPTPAMRMLL